VRWQRFASAAVLVVAILAAAACGGGGGGGGSQTTSSSSSSSGGCTDVSAPSPKDESNHKAPTSQLDPGKTYRVVVDTNCGQFTITLDQQTSPKTSASFASLVDDGYFDETIFHRIVPGFVIQGGDPTGTGTGGPGYTTVEPPPPSTTYVKYLVAMAKTAAEPAGASGSQFFVVTGPNVQLPADYAVLGKVTDGQAVVDRIGKLGDQNQQPTRPVVIDKMSVESS
jgi:peptidyl-prolyl cis-trans isomerase B (cyclophilin B)